MNTSHAWVLLIVMIGVSATAGAQIERTDLKIQGEPGIELFVREVADASARPGRVPIVLVHGARVPGIASFDLPVEGGSLAADLARAGHRVVIMDARGYGGSTRPDEMSRPPQGRPLVSSHEVVRDIDAVVQWIMRRASVSQVALLGWATGGHWSGMYASLHPERVSHLVVYNSLYGGTRGHRTLEDTDVVSLSAYRFSDAASLLRTWDNSIPLEDKALWRDPRVAAFYQSEALASDPTSSERDPPAFRAPMGAIQDSYYLAVGRQLWDAGSITAKVLIIRSENDFWSRSEDVTQLASHLTRAASVRTVTIPDGTHYVHLDRPERGRELFLRSVISHLNEDS